MKKLVVFLLIAVVTAGAAFANPIGLKVYVDGFTFGNVAAKNYRFAGEYGMAGVTPGIAYNTSLLDGSLDLAAGLQNSIVFSNPLEQDLRLNLKVGYNLRPTETTKVIFSVWDFFHFTGEDGQFADVGAGQVETIIGTGAQIRQDMDFGEIWAIFDVEFHKNLAGGTSLGIATGADNGFAVGVNLASGLYGSAGFGIAFNKAGAVTQNAASAGLTSTTLRLGYKTGDIDGRVSVIIPLMADGIKNEGIYVTPRFAYGNIIPGLEAYLALTIKNIAADAANIGIAPAVGVSYSF